MRFGKGNEIDDLQKMLENRAGKMADSGNGETKLVVCDVCKVPMKGWLARRCDCGAIVHAYCWEKHVLSIHGPGSVYGYVTPKGEFKPDDRWPLDKGKTMAANRLKSKGVGNRNGAS